MIPARPARHGFVWLAPGHGAAARFVSGASGIQSDAAHRLLGDWCDRAYPLIVARQHATTPAAHLRLGLALPPALGRHRLAFDVPCALLRRYAPPPRLSRIARMLPTHWQHTLALLSASACPAAREARVFGSAALQAITAQPCLAPHSDIDLLFRPGSPREAHELIGLLTHLDHAACPRLDGEIVDNDDRAANWRELASSAERLLVKCFDRVELVARSDFIAALGTDRHSGEEMVCP